MNIKKVKIGREHPMSFYERNDLHIFFSEEVYLNLDNVLYVTPFTRYIGNEQITFYCIQLIGEHHLFSMENIFTVGGE